MTRPTTRPAPRTRRRIVGTLALTTCLIGAGVLSAVPASADNGGVLYGSAFSIQKVGSDGTPLSGVEITVCAPNYFIGQTDPLAEGFHGQQSLSQLVSDINALLADNTAEETVAELRAALAEAEAKLVDAQAARDDAAASAALSIDEDAANAAIAAYDDAYATEVQPLVDEAAELRADLDAKNARLAELQRKQADGTITPEETAELATLMTETAVTQQQWYDKNAEVAAATDSISDLAEAKTQAEDDLARLQAARDALSAADSALALAQNDVASLTSQLEAAEAGLNDTTWHDALGGLRDRFQHQIDVQGDVAPTIVDGDACYDVVTGADGVAYVPIGFVTGSDPVTVTETRRADGYSDDLVGTTITATPSTSVNGDSLTTTWTTDNTGLSFIDTTVSMNLAVNGGGVAEATLVNEKLPEEPEVPTEPETPEEPEVPVTPPVAPPTPPVVPEAPKTPTPETLAYTGTDAAPVVLGASLLASLLAGAGALMARRRRA